MLLKRVKNFCKSLRRDDSGNALLLMALGMPVLIGSSGLAVDVAQWYIWKRELQYAADQGALAGAWASAEPEQVDNYETLARLEFNDNLSYLDGKVSDPGIGKEDWNEGTDNTVVVTASYTESLPFSSILWKNQATVSVRAQASFQAATNYTTCLLALDPDAKDAFVVGGSVSGTVSCGIGSLSNNTSAIRKDGSAGINVADIIAAGGVDENLAANGTIHEFISNLSNPWEDVTPPDHVGDRTYTCDTTATLPGPGTSHATVSTRTQTLYTYKQGTRLSNANTAVIYTDTGSHTNTDVTTKATNQALSNTPAEGYLEPVSDTGEVYTNSSWPSTAAKNKTIFEFKQIVVTKTYTNVVPDSGGTVTVSGSARNLQPGTYKSNIVIGCDTYFSPGVYVMEGTLDFGENWKVKGENVLFVFKGTGERMKLNAKSVVEFTGITYDQLVNTYGMSEEDAEKLNGMIIYDTISSQDIVINGGADVKFDGILYMPERHVRINGNASVAGSCMMLAAGTIELRGSATIQSLCLPATVTSFDIGGTTISVRLVA